MTVPNRGGWHRESEICSAATQTKHFILTNRERNKKIFTQRIPLVSPLAVVLKQDKNCSIKMNCIAMTRVFLFIIYKIVFSIVTLKKIGKSQTTAGTYDEAMWL